MVSIDPEVLIVGSGPIGATFARTIFDRRPSTEILMVEVGPQLTDPPGMNVKNLGDERERLVAQVRSQAPDWSEADIEIAASMSMRAPTGDRARPGTAYVDPERALRGGPDTMSAAAISTNVGGMGAHWTCACPHPAGRELPTFIGPDEWEPALARAQDLLCVTTAAYPATIQGEAARRALSAEFDDELPEGRKVQPMPLACRVLPDGSRYWTGVDMVLGPLASDPPASFELRSKTLCRRLVVDGGRVAQAVLRDVATGAETVVRPKVVVAACDGLRTPQLLWASGVRPTALGRYLNDHIQLMGAAALDQALVAQVAGDPEAGNLVDGRAIPGDTLIGVYWIPYCDDHPYHSQVMHLDLSPVQMGARMTADRTDIVGAGFSIPKDIQASDRVVMSDSEVDAYGMPKMRIDYSLTEKDRATIDMLKQRQIRMADALGGFAPGRKPFVMPLGSSLHYQGAFRMGTDDDGTSVCDPSCRVWGLPNLFVGGNGVIPTATAANPTLTSVAHAVRAAGSLVGLLS
ncbi:MAG TPA: GMC oxidoreductase [Microbacterium sp.]|uniref:GMC oxidoreductase n=1 Tax=Microbacterium sp. TaxID=51671 RepID=UPI002C55217E|nr:GMC oxidoreductase [Microbacterium sp.]HWI30571.1 GMC oxidoreductase [Microbacterium sp.]